MQELRSNIFRKIILLIVALLVPIVLLYIHSNYVTVKILEDKITSYRFAQFNLFLNRMVTEIDSVANAAVNLTKDKSVMELRYLHLTDSMYHNVYAKELVLNQIQLQATSTNWMDRLRVYTPYDGSVITLEPVISYDPIELETGMKLGWQYRALGSNSEFVWYTAEPFTAYEDVSKAHLVIEASIAKGTLVTFLDDYKSSGDGDPFLYHPVHGVITNRTAERDTIDGIVSHLAAHGEKSLGDRFTYNDDHLVMMTESGWMGWMLVDYVPLQQILSPINEMNLRFYAATGLLLIVSFFATLLLYRHVRLPLKELVVNLQRLKRGDFSARVHIQQENEFRYVGDQFNGMVEQMQELVEKVYLEQIRSREAKLKQLQSQINPHFLYNCLQLIKNKTILGEDEAVISMTENLGSYFRYATRLENPLATLGEEIDMILNYLTIQNLRMKRIEYEVDVPEPLLALKIPRLLLQPVVENAIVHGLEPRKQQGLVRIIGMQEEDMVRIVIEDNGPGMSEEARHEMKERLGRAMDEHMGYGVWNVNQRLFYQFGEGSGVRFDASELGGLKVILEWRSSDVSGIDRG